RHEWLTYPHLEEFVRDSLYCPGARVVLPFCWPSLSAVRYPLFTAAAEGRQPLQHLASGTGFDRILRHASRVGRRRSLAEHLEHERSLQYDRIAVRAVLPPLQNGTQMLGIVGGVAALQFIRRASRQRELLRTSHGARHPARSHVEERERSDRRRFVPTRLAMNDVRAFDRQAGNRMRHDLGDVDMIGADQMERRF